MASRAEVLGLMTIGSLALYGCVGEGKRQEPPPPDQPRTLEVDETATALVLPSETPTPFPTLTPTPTETLIPAIETGMELPGVVRVEQREEKWIGFDEDGKPITQSTDPSGKEWERFERELKILCPTGRAVLTVSGPTYISQYSAGYPVGMVEISNCDFLTPEMLEPLDASQVKPIRLVDAEGQIVEVEDGLFPGLDSESYGEDGELRGQTQAVAGVIRGYVPRPYSGGPDSKAIKLYIEVRLNEFESQGLFYTIPDYDDFVSYLKVLNPELGPEGVMNYAHVTMQPKELLDVFRNNESPLINQQVIFRMQVYLYGVDPQWLRDYALFLEALDSRRGSDVQRHIVLAELFVPRELELVPEEFIVERCGRSPLLMLPERWCGKSP